MAASPGDVLASGDAPRLDLSRYDSEPPTPAKTDGAEDEYLALGTPSTPNPQEDDMSTVETQLDTLEVGMGEAQTHGEVARSPGSIGQDDPLFPQPPTSSADGKLSKSEADG